MCMILKSYNDFARMSNANFSLKIEKVDILGAVNAVVEMYHEFAESKSIGVTVTIKCDPAYENINAIMDIK